MATDTSNPLTKDQDMPKAKTADVKTADVKTADVTDTKAVKDESKATATTTSVGRVKTADEVFIELLPDERVSRHAALKLVRALGLGCSQARMSKILLAKYGPEVKNASKAAMHTTEDRLKKEERRRAAETKALEAVRAKRKAAEEAGKKVDGYAPKPVKYEGGLEAAEAEMARLKEKADQAEVETDVKAEVKPDVKAEVKPDVKAEVKPDVKPAVKSKKAVKK